MNKILNRVPEVTTCFWIIKILATTVGETAADFLSETLSLGLDITSGIMGGLLCITLFNQFRLKRYIPVNYWLAVVFISIVGTLLTDKLVDGLGISLITTTIFFSIALCLTFALWYFKEKTLAMHSINTAKRELYYWIAILFTFALGTSAGDLLAETSGFGYGISGLIFAGLIGLFALGYFYLKMNAILVFWLTYILTRPLGASIGDLLSQPTDEGGFGYGTVGTSMLFLSIISSLVIYLSLTQKKKLSAVSIREQDFDLEEQELERETTQQQWLSKVPEITLIFWIIKILATTLGETGGDALSMSMKLGYLVSTGIFAAIFAIAVTAQILAKKFNPTVYWITIVATTTVGTTLADFVDRSLGIGYAGGSTILLILLMASLLVWYRTLGSVAVNTVRSPQSEMFYWITIMFSQTLGTALGDWTADTMDLGYIGAAIIFGSMLTAIALAYYRTKISDTALFWAAFILTRPLGAVVGDFLDKPISKGGLELSRYSASAVLLVLIVVLIFAFPHRAAKQAH